MPPTNQMEQEFIEAKEADVLTVCARAQLDYQEGKTDSPWVIEGLNKLDQLGRVAFGTNVPASSGSSRH